MMTKDTRAGQGALRSGTGSALVTSRHPQGVAEAAGFRLQSGGGAAFLI